MYASNSLWLGAGTLAILAALLAFSGFFRPATTALALLATAELLVFARQSLDTFVPAWDELREVKDCLQAHPGGDYRILNFVNANALALDRLIDDALLFRELGEPLLKALTAGAYRVRSFSRTEPTLEDVFLAATKRSWDLVDVPGAGLP